MSERDIVSSPSLFVGARGCIREASRLTGVLTHALPSLADMPGLLRDEIKVHLIQSRDHILNTYAEKISEYAEVRQVLPRVGG